MGPVEFSQFPLPPGKDAVLLLNVYSTVMLKTNGLTIMFDPVAIEAGQCRDIDVIVITHEHGDHFDRRLVGELSAINAPWILTTPFIARNLSPSQARTVTLKVGDSVAIAGVRFCAEYSDHPGNQPLAFVIKTENTTLYHPDDSQPFAAMREIAASHQLDVMLYLAISLVDMLEIAAIVKPGTILCPADPRLKTITLSNTRIVPLRQHQLYLGSRDSGWDGAGGEGINAG